MSSPLTHTPSAIVARKYNQSKDDKVTAKTADYFQNGIKLDAKQSIMYRELEDEHIVRTPEAMRLKEDLLQLKRAFQDVGAAIEGDIVVKLSKDGSWMNGQLFKAAKRSKEQVVAELVASLTA